MKKIILVGTMISSLLLVGCNYSEDQINIDENISPDVSVVPDENNSLEMPSTTEWKLLSGEVNDTCSKPTFSGEATIHGWYASEVLFDEQEWVFKVAKEDIANLPLQNVITDHPNFNETLNIVDASDSLEDQLKNASEENPELITIKGYSAYCEGSPRVSLEGVDALK